jgi:hypothetical protein
MDIAKIKAVLIAAVDRFSSMRYEDLDVLPQDRLIEDSLAAPDSDEYSQVEVEVLDRLVRNGEEALHIPVTVRDSSREIGTEFFKYRSGRVDWNREIYEFKNGVPHKLG